MKGVVFTMICLSVFALGMPAHSQTETQPSDWWEFKQAGPNKVVLVRTDKLPFSMRHPRWTKAGQVLEHVFVVGGTIAQYITAVKR